jgi:hypothetical protein
MPLVFRDSAKTCRATRISGTKRLGNHHRQRGPVSKKLSVLSRLTVLSVAEVDLVMKRDEARSEHERNRIRVTSGIIAFPGEIIKKFMRKTSAGLKRS